MYNIKHIIACERIAIIGCGGAGKTTLARHLHTLLKLPVYHLDQYYWLPLWQKPFFPDYEKQHQTLIEKDKWILDGIHMRTLPQRLHRADCIIFLDINRITCLYRIIKRRIKGGWHKRGDLPNQCQEQLRWDFLHYVLTFNSHRRSLVMQLLAEHQKKQVIILDSQKKVDHLLESIQATISLAHTM